MEQMAFGYVVEGLITLECIEHTKGIYRKVLAENEGKDIPEGLGEHFQHIHDYLANVNEPYWLFYKAEKHYPDAKAERDRLIKQFKGKSHQPQQFRVVKAKIRNPNNVPEYYEVIQW